MGILNKEYMFLAVVHNKGDLGYLINFPDIDECFTYADTLEHGLVLAKEALEYCIHGRQEHGDEIPVASKESDIELLFENDTIVEITANMRGFRDEVLENPIDRDNHIPEWLESIASTNREKLKGAMEYIVMEIERDLKQEVSYEEMSIL
ncbi:type II toxin-antitoxin system HicB family antitoxin [uncultured Clostridium sp.]|uniref:type II toxin-antitoxin system HicB family antitoxin n=1 Tax=uncultured Clostridium sp. TaxID=59620 RepID=UPI00262C9352|nr:type II toxin-antitoxin system HicB family antitoxin [uncultured Clostridium sp.]